MMNENETSLPAGFSLRHRLKPPPSGVQSFAWSPDGRVLASLSKGGTVQFWDADTGQNIRSYEGHSKRTIALAWANQGDTVAIGVENLVTLRDVGSGRLYRSFKSSFSRITALAWSPDDKILAVGYMDGSIQLWSPSGAPIWDSSRDDSLRGHTDRITKLFWFSNGCQFVSSSHDGTIKVWIPELRRISLSLEEESGINSIALAPNREILVSASNARTIRLWDLNTGRDLSVIEGHTDLVKDLCYSPDGSILASISQDNSVRFWRCEDWTMVALIRATQVASTSHGLAFHPKSSSIAILDKKDLVIQILDLDAAGLLNSSTSESVQYTTAKIVLSW